MAKEKFNSQEFLSSLFHYAHGFNFNHIILMQTDIGSQLV